jgi:tetratricopeptide (TPR) repeat protein
MKLDKNVIPCIVVLGFIVFSIFLFAQNVSASTITGTVYDNRNNAISDVDIELLDDLYRLIGRTRSDGAGRFEFGGLSDGRYTLKALPFRYDFLDQSQQVEIYTSTIRGQGNGNSLEIKDFYLLPRKGSLEEAEAGVVFAQEIPKEAKKAYEKAINDFSKKRTAEAVVSLNEAIKIFPKYFLALIRLGKEKVVKGEFTEAYPLFIKAVDVNQKSPTALYYLGYTLHKLNYNKAAVIALSQAYNVSPASVMVLTTLGITERLEGKFTDAEKHLLQAKKLSKTPIAEIHWELAQLYGENLKKYDAAADELEAFLKARPDAKDAITIKAMIKKLRDKAKAEASK